MAKKNIYHEETEGTEKRYTVGAGPAPAPRATARVAPANYHENKNFLCDLCEIFALSAVKNLFRLVRLRVFALCILHFALCTIFVPLCLCAFHSTATYLAPTFEFKKTGENLLPFQNGLPMPTYVPELNPQIIRLDDIWKKERVHFDTSLSLQKRDNITLSLLDIEAGKKKHLDFDDSKWETIEIPSVENPPLDAYNEGVWYRKKFEIPQKFNGKFIKLVFLASNYISDIWLNGQWIGYHEGGYTPYSFDVSRKILYGKKNILLVRLYNPPWPDDKEKILLPERKITVPYKDCDWWNYFGIYRDVYLEISPYPSIEKVQIKAGKNNENKDEINVNIITKGTGSIKIEIFPATECRLQIVECGLSNVLPSVQEKVAIEKIYEHENIPIDNKYYLYTKKFIIKDAKYWSPDFPNLYVAVMKLFQDNTLKNTKTVEFGFRNISVDKKTSKLLLNGEPIILKGIARHEELPDRGRAFSQFSPKDISYLYNDMLKLKELGVNFIRTAHYPNHSFLYTLADRMGFLCAEEIPVYWFDEEGFEIQMQRKIAEQMWIEMITKDINHPSIIFWSTSNETIGGIAKKKFLKRLRELAYNIDGTRLILQSGLGFNPYDDSHQLCDVIGLTMYYGVFSKDDIRSGTEHALKLFHSYNPGKPIVATEFGIWADTEEEEKNQTKIFQETISAFRKFPFVAGFTWWTAFDYYSIHVNRPQHFGIITYDRKTKRSIFNIMKKEYQTVDSR